MHWVSQVLLEVKVTRTERVTFFKADLLWADHLCRSRPAVDGSLLSKLIYLLRVSFSARTVMIMDCTPLTEVEGCSDTSPDPARGNSPACPGKSTYHGRVTFLKADLHNSGFQKAAFFNPREALCAFEHTANNK